MIHDTEQLAVDLLSLSTDGIISIMSQLDTTRSYSVEFKYFSYNFTIFSFFDYTGVNLFLCELIYREPGRMIPLLDDALLVAQKYLKKIHHLKDHLSIKSHAKVRLTRMIVCERSSVPRSADVGNLIVFSGKVIRTGMVKVLEIQRNFQCVKCGMSFPMTYDREQYNLVPKPFQCQFTGCVGSKFKEIISEIGENPCCDYQEIKIQEDVSKLVMGYMPRAITVVLESDLVDQCKAGDNISVVGIVSRRWHNFVLNERCDVELFILANNVTVHNRQHVDNLLTDELCKNFESFWEKNANDPIAGKPKQIIMPDRTQCYS